VRRKPTDRKSKAPPAPDQLRRDFESVEAQREEDTASGDKSKFCYATHRVPNRSSLWLVGLEKTDNQRESDEGGGNLGDQRQQICVLQVHEGSSAA